MAFGSAAELLFTAKGDTDSARSEFRKLKDEIGDTTTTATGKGSAGFESFAKSIGVSEGAASKFGSVLGGPVTIAAAIAAAGIVAVVSASVQLTQALFNLTTQAAEYGSEIFDASEKTGLNAETLSSMKFAADQSGTSLDAVTAASAKFAKTIDEAANGSEKAKVKLERLGVTSHDLDTALGQALTTIAKYPPGVEQMTAAQLAFGKSGADLLPFIKSFDGDLPGLIAKCKELGVTLSDKDAAAADAFGDQMDTLNAQLAGVSRTIGFAVMPVFMNMATSISNWLAQNQGEIQAWGFKVGVIFQGVVEAVKGLANLIVTIAPVVRASLALTTFGASEALIRAAESTLASLDAAYAVYKNQQANAGRSGGARAGGTSSFEDTESDPKAKAAAEKRRREREAAQKQDLAARIQLEKANLKEVEDAYKESLGAIREEFKKNGGSWEEFLAKTANAAKTFKTDTEEVLNELFGLQDQESQGALESQRELLSKQQEDLIKALNAKVKAEGDANIQIAQDAIKIRKKGSEDLEADIAKIEKLRLENFRKSERERYETEIKNGRNVLENLIALRDFEEEQLELDKKYELERQEAEHQTRLAAIKGHENEAKEKEAINALYEQKALLTEEEFQLKLKEIRDRINGLAAGDTSGTRPRTVGGEEQPGGLLGGLIEGLGTSIDKMLEKTEPLKGIGNIIGYQFNLIAQAVGNAVKAFVLFGSAGGSFRKFAAEILASIAQMAIVQAVWELAQGFAMLALAYFTGNAKYGAAATAHFIAAGVYGAIGGVAAIAGRAVAGDSFKKETSGAYGSAGQTASTGSQNRNTSGQGQVYSQFGDEATIIDAGRNAPNAPGPNVVEIRLKDRSNWFSEMFEVEFNRNGRMRSIIQDA